MLANIAVERREAQRPGGGPRKPAIAGRARLGAGLANPLSLARTVPRSQGAPQGVSQTPGASRRSIFLFGGNGKRERATRALAKTGGGALAIGGAARYTERNDISLPNLRRVLRLFAGLAALRARNRGRDFGDSAALVDDARGTMRCAGNRCVALDGEIGVATACTIYAVRPEVCRACQPGDDSCMLARRHYGLPELTPAELAAP